jgi:hypothetical protein
MTESLAQETPAMVVRWLLDKELAGDMVGLTALAVLKDGSVHYINLGRAPFVMGAAPETVTLCREITYVAPR